MQGSQKLPIVLAALLFVLAAVAEIAAGRGRPAPDEGGLEQARRAALLRVETALARDDVADALRAWQQAYDLARRTRSWHGLAEAADAHLRIGAAANASEAAAPRARQLYLAALGRARAERSVEGAVRAAEGFAGLGDAGAAALALRLADSLATHAQDPGAAARVESVRARLLDDRPDLTARKF